MFRFDKDSMGIAFGEAVVKFHYGYEVPEALTAEAGYTNGAEYKAAAETYAAVVLVERRTDAERKARRACEDATTRYEKAKAAEAVYKAANADVPDCVAIEKDNAAEAYCRAQKSWKEAAARLAAAEELGVTEADKAAAHGLKGHALRLCGLYAEAVLRIRDAANFDAVLVEEAVKACRAYRAAANKETREARRQALGDLLAFYGGAKVAKVNAAEADFIGDCLIPAVNIVGAAIDKKRTKFTFVMKEAGVSRYASIMHKAVFMKAAGIKFTAANVATNEKKLKK